MPNGQIGDHPYTDIVIHRRRVYSEAADELVREIAGLADDQTRRELSDRLLNHYNEYSRPDVRALERELTAQRDRLRKEVTSRGWESTE